MGLAKWLSRDPIEERGGLNLYEFCRDNGVDAIDSDGRYTLLFPIWWSQADVDKFYSSLAMLRPMLRHAEHLIQKRLKYYAQMNPDCANRMPTVRQYLFGLAVIKQIDSDLDSNSKTLLITKSNAKGESGYEVQRFSVFEIGLNDLSDSTSLLHELSHIYGTDDGQGGLLDLHNAHEFERIMNGGTCDFNNIEFNKWDAVGRPPCCDPRFFDGYP
jgi:hypothetical protein